MQKKDSKNQKKRIGIKETLAGADTLLMEKQLKEQTVHIEELIGPKGKNQKSMRRPTPALGNTPSIFPGVGPMNPAPPQATNPR